MIIYRKKYWFRLVTTFIVAVFLSQNIIWAGPSVRREFLAPTSEFFEAASRIDMEMAVIGRYLLEKILDYNRSNFPRIVTIADLFNKLFTPDVLLDLHRRNIATLLYKDEAKRIELIGPEFTLAFLDADEFPDPEGGFYQVPGTKIRVDIYTRPWLAQLEPEGDRRLRELIARVRASYRRGVETDYYMPPIVVETAGKKGLIKDGDSVVFCCRRGEREIQLTEAFTDPRFSEFPVERFGGLCFAILTLYDEKFRDLPVVFPPLELKNTISEVRANAGRRQLKVAESEKGAHVTGTFYGGGKKEKWPGENWHIIPSERPGWMMEDVTEYTVEEMAAGQHHSIDINLAGPDIIGHLLDFDEKVRCAEAVDKCIGRLAEEAEKHGYVLLFTADHGCLEEAVNEDGSPHVGHTTNPVRVVLLDPQAKKATFKSGGISASVAPTLLEIEGLEKPGEMTAESLLENCPAELRGRKVLHVIVDGWGLGKEDSTNPIHVAQTPNWDRLVAEYPSTTIEAAGPAVGLLPGKAGNSEAGHQNLGAGRVVPQDDVRIQKAIEEGTLFENETLINAIERAKRNDSALHLIGLLSERSSHGSMDVPVAVAKMARDRGVKEIYFHQILDGRSTPPQSAPEYLGRFVQRLRREGFEGLIDTESSTVLVKTIIGRGFALDRDRNYPKNEMAYAAMVYGTEIPQPRKRPPIGDEDLRRVNRQRDVTRGSIGRAIECCTRSEYPAEVFTHVYEAFEKLRGYRAMVEELRGYEFEAENFGDREEELKSLFEERVSHFIELIQREFEAIGDVSRENIVRLMQLSRMAEQLGFNFCIPKYLLTKIELEKAIAEELDILARENILPLMRVRSHMSPLVGNVVAEIGEMTNAPELQDIVAGRVPGGYVVTREGVESVVEEIGDRLMGEVTEIINRGNLGTEDRAEEVYELLADRLGEAELRERIIWNYRNMDSALSTQEKLTELRRLAGFLSEEAEILEAIKRLDPEILTSNTIGDLIMALDIGGITDELIRVYRKHGGVFTVLRPSLVFEDTFEDPMADGLKDIPYVRGGENVWKVFLMVQARYWVTLGGIDSSQPVLFQKMIVSADADVSADSINRGQDNWGEIVITAGYGGGSGLDKELADCDTYTINKSSNRVTGKQIADKSRQAVFDKERGIGAKTASVRARDAGRAAINRARMKEAVGIVKRLEDYFGCEVNVEMVIKGDKIYVAKCMPVGELRRDLYELSGFGIFAPDVARISSVKEDLGRKIGKKKKGGERPDYSSLTYERLLEIIELLGDEKIRYLLDTYLNTLYALRKKRIEFAKYQWELVYLLSSFQGFNYDEARGLVHGLSNLGSLSEEEIGNVFEGKLDAGLIRELKKCKETTGGVVPQDLIRRVLFDLCYPVLIRSLREEIERMDEVPDEVRKQISERFKSCKGYRDVLAVIQWLSSEDSENRDIYEFVYRQWAKKIDGYIRKIFEGQTEFLEVEEEFREELYANPLIRGLQDRINRQELYDTVRYLFPRLYDNVPHIKDLDKPTIIILNTSSRVSGRGTIRLLSRDLDIISYFHGSVLRECARRIIPADVSPELHMSSFEAVPLLSGHYRQGVHVAGGINDAVKRLLRENKSVIIRSTVAPGLIEEDYFEDANVVRVLVVVEDEETHKERFAEETRTRSQRIYRYGFQAIRQMQVHFKEIADGLRMLVVDNTDTASARRKAVDWCASPFTDRYYPDPGEDLLSVREEKEKERLFLEDPYFGKAVRIVRNIRGEHVIYMDIDSINGGDPASVPESERGRLKRMFEETGMKGVLNISFSDMETGGGISEIRDIFRELVEDSIRFAGKAGIEGAVVSEAILPGGIKGAKELLQRLVGLGEESGVTVSVENRSNGKRLIKILRDVPGLGFLLNYNLTNQRVINDDWGIIRSRLTGMRYYETPKNYGNILELEGRWEDMHGVLWIREQERRPLRSRVLVKGEMAAARRQLTRESAEFIRENWKWEGVWQLEKKEGYEGLFTLLTEKGCRGVSLIAPMSVSPELLERVNSCAGEKGIESITMDLRHQTVNLASRNPKIREAAIGLVKRVIDLAGHSGIGTVTVPLGWMGMEEDDVEECFEIQVDVLKEIVGYAGKKGVKILAGNKEAGGKVRYVAATPLELARLIFQVPGLMAEIDIDHANSIMDPLLFIREFNAQLGKRGLDFNKVVDGIYISDSKRKEKYRHYALGTGKIDFESVFGELVDIGYKGRVVLNARRQKAKKKIDQREMLTNDMEYIDALLARAERGGVSPEAEEVRVEGSWEDYSIPIDLRETVSCVPFPWVRDTVKELTPVLEDLRGSELRLAGFVQAMVIRLAQEPDLTYDDARKILSNIFEEGKGESANAELRSYLIEQFERLFIGGLKSELGDLFREMWMATEIREMGDVSEIGEMIERSRAQYPVQAHLATQRVASWRRKIEREVNEYIQYSEEIDTKKQSFVGIVRGKIDFDLKERTGISKICDLVRYMYPRLVPGVLHPKRIDRPTIVLVTGSSGTGKSTASRALSDELKVPVYFSTDHVREPLRGYIGRGNWPSVFRSSFELEPERKRYYGERFEELIATAASTDEAVDTILTSREWAPYRREVLEHYYAHGIGIFIGIRAAIDRLIDMNSSAIIEGVPLIPGLLPEDYFDRANIEHMVVTVSDRYMHQDRFTARGRETTAEERDPKRYLESFPAIRCILEHIVEMARVSNKEVLENVRTEEMIQQAVGRIKGSATDRGLPVDDRVRDRVALRLADADRRTLGRGIASLTLDLVPDLPKAREEFYTLDEIERLLDTAVALYREGKTIEAGLRAIKVLLWLRDTPYRPLRIEKLPELIEIISALTGTYPENQELLRLIELLRRYQDEESHIYLPYDLESIDLFSIRALLTGVRTLAIGRLPESHPDYSPGLTRRVVAETSLRSAEAIYNYIYGREERKRFGDWTGREGIEDLDELMELRYKIDSGLVGEGKLFETEGEFLGLLSRALAREKLRGADLSKLVGDRTLVFALVDRYSHLGGDDRENRLVVFHKALMKIKEKDRDVFSAFVEMHLGHGLGLHEIEEGSEDELGCLPIDVKNLFSGLGNRGRGFKEFLEVLAGAGLYASDLRSKLEDALWKIRYELDIHRHLIESWDDYFGSVFRYDYFLDPIRVDNTERLIKEIIRIFGHLACPCEEGKSGVTLSGKVMRDKGEKLTQYVQRSPDGGCHSGWMTREQLSSERVITKEVLGEHYSPEWGLIRSLEEGLGFLKGPEIEGRTEREVNRLVFSGVQARDCNLASADIQRVPSPFGNRLAGLAGTLKEYLPKRIRAIVDEIPVILSVGDTGTSRYPHLEYVEGIGIKIYLNRQDPFSVTDRFVVTCIAQQIVEIFIDLAVAHQRDRSGLDIELLEYLHHLKSKNIISRGFFDYAILYVMQKAAETPQEGPSPEPEPSEEEKGDKPALLDSMDVLGLECGEKKVGGHRFVLPSCFADSGEERDFSARLTEGRTIPVTDDNRRALDAIEAFNRFEDLNYEVIVLMREIPIRRGSINEILRKLKEGIALWEIVESIGRERFTFLEIADFRTRLKYLERRLQEQFPPDEGAVIEDRRLITEFIAEIGKGKVRRQVKPEKIETLNEFLNQMHMRITTQVFRLQESDTPGKLYDLNIVRGGGAPEEQIPICWATEHSTDEMPPSLECLLGMVKKYGFRIDTGSRIMVTDNNIWMDFLLGDHSSRIFVRFTPPEKGGCVIVNWIERGPDDSALAGHVVRSRIIGRALEQAGFSLPVEVAKYDKDSGARTIQDILLRYPAAFATVGAGRKTKNLDMQFERFIDRSDVGDAEGAMGRNFCASYFYDHYESVDASNRLRRPAGGERGPVDVILAEYEEQAPGVIRELNGLFAPLGIGIPGDRALIQENIDEFINGPLFKAINERRAYIRDGELVKNEEWEEVSVMDTFGQMVNDPGTREEMIKTADIYNILRDQGLTQDARTIGYLGAMEIREMNYALVNGLDLKVFAFVSPKTGDAVFGIACLGSCLYKSGAELKSAENVLKASLTLNLLQGSAYLDRETRIGDDLEYIKLQIDELLEKTQTLSIRPVIFQEAPSQYISGDGIVSGKIAFSLLKEGEILVTDAIRPEDKEMYRAAGAVIAVSGSATSHGGIELRGLGKSCLVGGELIGRYRFRLATQKEQEKRYEINVMGRTIPGILTAGTGRGRIFNLKEGDIVSVNCIDNTIEVVSEAEHMGTYPIIEKILNCLRDMDDRRNKKAQELMGELRSIYGGDSPYRRRIVLFTLRELIFADYLKGKEETRMLIGEILNMMREQREGAERLDILAERLLMSYFTEVLKELLSLLNRIGEISKSEAELSAVNDLNAYLYRILKARRLLGELRGLADYLNIKILDTDLFDSFVGKVREAVRVLGPRFKDGAVGLVEKDVLELGLLRTMRAGLRHAATVFPMLREDADIRELLRIGEELDGEYLRRSQTIDRPLVLDFDDVSMVTRGLTNLKAVNTARLHKRLTPDAVGDILDRAGAGDYKLETIGGKILTAEFSKRLMVDTGLWEKILSIVRDVDDPEQASERIKGLIRGATIPEELRQVVDTAYNDIEKEYVIVRSSGPTEDLPGEIGAGRYYSALYVKKEKLYKAVLAVIASFWDIDNVRQIREDPHLNIDNYLMAMMIQEQLDADVSGVLFTGNPTTGNLEHAFIDAGYGNGIGTMGGVGKVPTDRFVVWKGSGKKGEDGEEPLIARKTAGMFFDKERGEWDIRDIPEDMWKRDSLSEPQKRALLEVGLFLEELYGYPRDIEFLIDWENKRIVIVQMRRILEFDISVLAEAETPPEKPKGGEVNTFRERVRGLAGIADEYIGLERHERQEDMARDIQGSLAGCTEDSRQSPLIRSMAWQVLEGLGMNKEFKGKVVYSLSSLLESRLYDGDGSEQLRSLVERTQGRVVFYAGDECSLPESCEFLREHLVTGGRMDDLVKEQEMVVFMLDKKDRISLNVEESKIGKLDGNRFLVPLGERETGPENDILLGLEILRTKGIIEEMPSLFKMLLIEAIKAYLVESDRQTTQANVQRILQIELPQPGEDYMKDIDDSDTYIEALISA